MSEVLWEDENTRYRLYIGRPQERDEVVINVLKYVRDPKKNEWSGFELAPGEWKPFEPLTQLEPHLRFSGVTGDVVKKAVEEFGRDESKVLRETIKRLKSEAHDLKRRAETAEARLTNEENKAQAVVKIAGTLADV